MCMSRGLAKFYKTPENATVVSGNLFSEINLTFANLQVMQIPIEMLAGKQITSCVLPTHCPSATEQAVHTWV